MPSTLPAAAFCCGARLELGELVASGGPSTIKFFTSTLAMNLSTPRLILRQDPLRPLFLQRGPFYL